MKLKRLFGWTQFLLGIASKQNGQVTRLAKFQDNPRSLISFDQLNVTGTLKSRIITSFFLIW